MSIASTKLVLSTVLYCTTS